MKNRVILALLLSLVGVANARADGPVRAPNWSLGGAAVATSDAARITLWSTEDGMSAGLASTSAAIANGTLSGSGMQTGGFLAWQSSIYRIDATLNPSFDGTVTAGLGASVGAMPGEQGTRYGFRIGTAWTQTDHFTINPASGLGLAELGEMGTPSNNVNVSLLINHALTPNLNLIGMAEAQRAFGVSPLDGSYSSGIGRLVVGAGLGYKF